ncbi:mastermind-like protein 2 [Hyperolius riggenbachi]|uniref:mastermind-like protein 2 n=1 Tax=Hyperolius riggenbachi TaxID=752182 RepID=UPI0035A31029
MGETAPPQAPAGSLGINVSGVGLLGGGAVAPRLHSAIVERLRARFAVLRQHNLNCEGRYERSRAESSDRERENTLQLMTVVQHGQSNRKTSKHSKSACAAPPDYRQHQQQMLSDNASDVSGEQHHQTANGLGQRNPALIALQGSLKRRLVVNVAPPNSKRSNGVSDNSFLDFKKIRANDCLSSGQNMYHGVDGVNTSMNGVLPMEQVLHRKNNNATNDCAANDLFNSTLKDIKKEPGESLPCDKHLDPRISHENLFRYGDDSGEQLMDPDLQELFNEFTYISVPPMSDLELQNMINITIKQDEPFNIDIGQHSQRNPVPSTPLDKVVIKTEYSPCLNPTRVGSPQIRPSSTGPPFSMSSSPLTSSASVTVPHSHGQQQVSSCPNRLNTWQELSHAQQLKQIAANRQNNLIQQQQTGPSPNWSSVQATGQSSRQYGLEKVPSPFRSQQLSPRGTSGSPGSVSTNQQKSVGNYLYKNNSNLQSASLDMMKAQDANKNSVNASHMAEEQHHGLTKPLFHYSPEQASQPGSSVLVPPNKAMLPFPQQQKSNPSQQHEQAQQVNSMASSQSLPRSGGFQQKMVLPKMQQSQQMPGMQYTNVHQQQEQLASATQSPSSSTSTTSCSSPNGFSNQQPLLNQQMADKTNILQRQMMQQQMIAGTEKCNNQDQLNRHLTRPPPDYKDQRRNAAGMQQTNQFHGGLQSVGPTSDPPVTNSASAHVTHQNPAHSSSHGSRMTSLQGSPNMFGNVPCPQQMYSNVNQMQAQTSPNHRRTSPNSSVMSRQSTVTTGSNVPTFGNPPGVTSPPFRPGSTHGGNTVGQRPSNITSNSAAGQKWITSDIKRQEVVNFNNNSQFSNQSLPAVMGHQHFPQRGLSLPGQVNQNLQMNAVNQINSGQSMEPLRGFNHGQSPHRPQVLTNLSQAGGTTATPTTTYNQSDQISRAFLRSDSNNDLSSFDFISQNGGLGSSPSNDSDFIDALLKTGPINDDWMKDIILDEIFKGHT